jgi:hypothetical protein
MPGAMRKMQNLVMRWIWLPIKMLAQGTRDEAKCT